MAKWSRFSVGRDAMQSLAVRWRFTHKKGIEDALGQARWAGSCPPHSLAVFRTTPHPLWVHVMHTTLLRPAHTILSIQTSTYSSMSNWYINWWSCTRINFFIPPPFIDFLFYLTVVLWLLSIYVQEPLQPSLLCSLSWPSSYLLPPSRPPFFYPFPFPFCLAPSHLLFSVNSSLFLLYMSLISPSYNHMQYGLAPWN